MPGQQHWLVEWCATHRTVCIRSAALPLAGIPSARPPESAHRRHGACAPDSRARTRKRPPLHIRLHAGVGALSEPTPIAFHPAGSRRHAGALACAHATDGARGPPRADPLSTSDDIVDLVYGGVSKRSPAKVAVLRVRAAGWIVHWMDGSASLERYGGGPRRSCR